MLYAWFIPLMPATTPHNRATMVHAVQFIDCSSTFP